MKFVQLKIQEHQPYLASPIRIDYKNLLPKKAKNFIDQLNDDPNKFKQEQNKQLQVNVKRRLYNASDILTNESEHLPRINKNSLQTVISDRHSNSVYKTIHNNPSDLISKYSILQVDYKNGISSGKKISPVKLQKHMWKQSLDQLLKCHH